MAFSPNAVLPDEQSAYLQNIVALLEQLVSNNKWEICQSLGFSQQQEPS